MLHKRAEYTDADQPFAFHLGCHCNTGWVHIRNPALVLHERPCRGRYSLPAETLHIQTLSPPATRTAMTLTQNGIE